MISDTKKARLLLAAASILVALSAAYAMLYDAGLDSLEARLRRKIYYERSIAGKGLGLHRAMHWSEAPEER